MNSLTNENTRLGFIGIGNMGSRMAKRLLDHGYQLIAYDRTRETAEALVKYGATVADSIAELASKADVVLSSLTNDDVVKSVYTDPQGVLAYLRRGSAIIEMSTVLPSTSRELYDLSHKAGGKFLDSPVSGSTPSAEEGTLTLFCGGDEELFQAAQPIFSSIGRQYFYLGGSGSGTAMKLVANTLLGVGMQAIAESVALGQKEGLDRHRLLEVLSHTAVIAPAHVGKLSRADLGDYSAQFAIRLMNKDFGLVLETAAAAKVPMPATAAAFQMNVAELSEGNEEDFSAVIKLMERLARLETSDAKRPSVASLAGGSGNAQ
jgi:3-hydroxyisobutyrate dehydrogenase